MMRSIDTNINNPMIADDITLQKSYNAFKNPEVHVVSQEFYDLLQTKDPFIIYVIENTWPVKMYYGDNLINNNTESVSYVMGPSDKYGEYIIYLWRRVNGIDNMIEIRRYNNPQSAVNDLNVYNRVGSHGDRSKSVYEIINSYIDEEISIHDMIMSIIAVFGFKDDPRFNDLNCKFMPYGMLNNNPYRDIPGIAVEMIKRKAESDSDSLFKYYLGIYNKILVFDFFKGDKYHRYVDMRDLSDEVRKICSVFITEIKCKFS